MCRGVPLTCDISHLAYGPPIKKNQCISQTYNLEVELMYSQFVKNRD